MLTLSLRTGDQVKLQMPDGREGILTITTVNGDKVRVGFEFPRDIRIGNRVHLTPAQRQAYRASYERSHK